MSTAQHSITDTVALAPGTTVWLAYLDARGNYSEREITVERVRVNHIGERIICATCHLRGEYRCFLASRILDVRVTPLLAQTACVVPPGIDSYVRAVA